jgi:hypothetical protein
VVPTIPGTSPVGLGSGSAMTVFLSPGTMVQKFPYLSHPLVLTVALVSPLAVAIATAVVRDS